MSEIPIASAAERMESITPTEKSGGVDNVLPRCAGSPAANTIVSVQVPPTSVATMYLRVISLMGFHIQTIPRRSADENYACRREAMAVGLSAYRYASTLGRALS